MKYLTFLFLLQFTCLALSGQNTAHTLKKDSSASSPPATIKEVSWIAGHWQGEAFGGRAEEIWTPPLGGTMMGAFKLSMENDVAFYELCIIREIGESIILQLKHFEHDLKGWEEKDETVDFPLVKITRDKVFFDQFTFERISENEMHLYVVIHNKDQAPSEVQFAYKRVQ